jgi:hypothetical protein
MCKRCIEAKKPLRCMVLTGGYDYPGCWNFILNELFLFDNCHYR